MRIEPKSNSERLKKEWEVDVSSVLRRIGIRADNAVTKRRISQGFTFIKIVGGLYITYFVVTKGVSYIQYIQTGKYPDEISKNPKEASTKP